MAVNKSKLTKKDLTLLNTFSKACRHDVLAMTTNSQSGHPGGSLGMVDVFSVLYTQILSKTGDPIIVSNGHISPAVYAVLGNMGYISRKEVVRDFRKMNTLYEGHVTRHVPGVWYGTGPLGAGAGAASGFALAQKLRQKTKDKPQTSKVYCTVGDGESQEGQVYEMMHFAAKYKLDNLIVFMDYNQVQLTDSLNNVMPYDPEAHFEASGWEVLECNGHDYQDIWKTIQKAHAVKNKPVFVLTHTIMGKGVKFMEADGAAYKATWHGKTAKPEQSAPELERLTLTAAEEQQLAAFRNTITWNPKKATFGNGLQPVKVKVGEPKVYAADVLTDCRSAYGNALLDLAKENKNVIAITADLADSVKTAGVKKELPEQHIDVGVAEQQLVSCAGGASFMGMIPFCSTFGAFMTSRAKDQARVNDINEANVKMVATHCGLSVGEDGPTHQAIDDSGSMLGFFNTMQIEPADPNHCDRIIRYIASHYGNFYVRMGRHKIPVLTKENGKVFFDASYQYRYGRCDVLRKGKDVTIAATGATVIEAVRAWETLQENNIRAEIVIVSSIKKFDAALFNSIKKTKRLVTVEDHNPYSGLAGQLAAALQQKTIQVEKIVNLGVTEYQLSGTAAQLYKAAGIDSGAIMKAVKKVIKK